MIKFYIIQSTKKNKNGHVPHLMLDRGDNILEEISPSTGKPIMGGKLGWYSIEYFINELDYELVKPERAFFVGSQRFQFLDYLKDKNMIREEI